MIDSFVKIIENIIKLINRRSKNNKEIFEKQIDPIFSEIIRIHKDYRHIIEDARKIIIDKSITSTQIISLLKERRKELLILREKVTALGKVLTKQKGIPKEAFCFFESVHWYFDTASSNDSYVRGGSAITNLMTVLRHIDNIGDQPIERMSKEIIFVEYELERRWERLLESYAEARVELQR